MLVRDIARSQDIKWALALAQHDHSKSLALDPSSDTKSTDRQLWSALPLFGSLSLILVLASCIIIPPRAA